MSGTRSPSRKGPATKPLAIIVAHGSPSDPKPVDRAVKALAAQVAALTAAWRVTGATLARPGSLAEALANAEEGTAVAIYPFFMSNGWFVQAELRRRVAASIRRPVAFLEPFGLDTALPELCISIAAECARRPADTALILAAHGSSTGNTASAAAARHIERQIAGSRIFGEVRLGFVEQEPSIAEAASGLGGRAALCLPLFATMAGHVTGDVPRQLAAAGFEGTLLPPIGASDAAAGLIAGSLAHWQHSERM